MAAPGVKSTGFSIEPCSYAQVRELADGLGVSEPVAAILARRGFRSVEEALTFLDASEWHDPFRFEGMEEVVGLLGDAIGAGRQITIHGDYDVDGVCATAILVSTVRALGGECDWYLPDRVSDGYGLSAETVQRLSSRGTELLVTADCGIGCPEEVALARELGLDVVVTDHHQPGERLPGCPILHPRISGYPFGELCGTGVAHKLAVALRERSACDAADREPDLDLVALATVADLVPLQGENRSLVRAGLAEARRARRPGLRALMAAAGCGPERLDEGDLAFRLAPRINAAGRLYRADAGVELMLTRDPERAAAIAEELNRANSERRTAEADALAGAERALAELPDELRAAPGIVVAGAGWHPGVVGIVASRIVERHWRPAIVLGIDGDGRARGSGRSIPGFDLLGGLRECADHLTRFGGHSAAAGLELDASEIDAFREAFVAHVERALGPEDLVRSEPVDAIVGGESLGIGLAEELERLGPFGKGNPEPRLLVPAARLSDVRPMGEGKHARFSIASGAHRASGVAFRVNGELERVGTDPLDVAVGLELNQWNGSVEPRVILRELFPVGRADDGEPGCSTPAEPGEWWQRFDAELGCELSAWPPAIETRALAARTVIDRRGGSGIACIAALLSTGASVLAVCADVSRRRALLPRVAPARFGGGASALACGRCAAGRIAERVEAVVEPGGGLLLADWAALQLSAALLGRFEHVVVVDPPPFRWLRSLLETGDGYLHLAWGRAEAEFAARVHDAEWALRPALAATWRALREATEATDGEAPLSASAALDLLAGGAPHPRAPEQAARQARVLDELGLIRLEGTAASRSLRVVSSVGTDLDRSAAFRAYRERHQEGTRYLSSETRRQ